MPERLAFPARPLPCNAPSFACSRRYMRRGGGGARPDGPEAALPRQRRKPHHVPPWRSGGRLLRHMGMCGAPRPQLICRLAYGRPEHLTDQNFLFLLLLLLAAIPTLPLWTASTYWSVCRWGSSYVVVARTLLPSIALDLENTAGRDGRSSGRARGDTHHYTSRGPSLHLFILSSQLPS